MVPSRSAVPGLLEEGAAAVRACQDQARLARAEAACDAHNAWALAGDGTPNP